LPIFALHQRFQGLYHNGSSGGAGEDWEFGVGSFVLKAVEGGEDFPGRFFVLPGLDFGIILLK
jgi:hypothetical protein